MCAVCGNSCRHRKLANRSRIPCVIQELRAGHFSKVKEAQKVRTITACIVPGARSPASSLPFLATGYGVDWHDGVRELHRGGHHVCVPAFSDYTDHELRPLEGDTTHEIPGRTRRDTLDCRPGNCCQISAARPLHRPRQG